MVRIKALCCIGQRCCDFVLPFFKLQCLCSLALSPNLITISVLQCHSIPSELRQCESHTYTGCSPVHLLQITTNPAQLLSHCIKHSLEQLASTQVSKSKQTHSHSQSVLNTPVTHQNVARPQIRDVPARPLLRRSRFLGPATPCRSSRPPRDHGPTRQPGAIFIIISP